MQLQIDIPENVFVFREKWCRNSHLHGPPPLLLLLHQPLPLLPLSLVPARASLSLSPHEWQPAIHFHHSEQYFPLPSIVTAPDHCPDRPAHCSHCVPDSYCLVAIETCLELLPTFCPPVLVTWHLEKTADQSGQLIVDTSEIKCLSVADVQIFI